MKVLVRASLVLPLVGAVLVALAGCSSTGSTGAGQDDVVATPSTSVPSSPAASSAAPAAPDSAPATASQSALTSSQSNGLDVCDSGLAYACGDIGPGGGTVFYANSTAFACGANLASMCNFLESAPNLWNPDSQHSCTGSPCGGSAQVTSDFSGTGKGITACTGSGEKASVAGAMGTAVGTGFANTSAMLAVCNAYDAGPVARAYAGGGLTDWSLPSVDELSALYQYPNRASIGGFNSGDYWSSTGVQQKCADFTAAAASVGLYVTMGGSTMNPGGQTLCDTKQKAMGVRPVRAF